VNVANGGWVTYPQVGACFNDYPNTQFDKTYQCFVDVPQTIQVCFQAFENDPNPFVPCDIVKSCLEETCVDLPVPPQGTANHVVALPDNQGSDGEVQISIVTNGFPGGYNDMICNAIDFGTLQGGATLGNANLSLFNNYCSSNANEPDPSLFGTGWINNVGVWFSFTTNNNPGSHIQVIGKSDPSNLGDPVNVQLAAFTSTDNTCNGTFSMAAATWTPGSYDESLLITCPKPNTKYFILMDGVLDSYEQLVGIFGLEIKELGVQGNADLVCDAESLGAVPLGGSVNSGLNSNACATSANDPTVAAFTLQNTVWFTFSPPPTGHVFVEAVSDVSVDPIGLQMAVYESSNNGCNGVFTELASSYAPANNDETIELACLDPNQTYYLLIDGAAGNLKTGIFTLTVRDAGDITPVTVIDTTLCFGGSISVANSIYNQPGNFIDTIELATGCDSIVITNVSVLNELVLNFALVQQGVGQGNTKGIASVNPTGGAGGYNFQWSDGQNGALASGLAGGDTYCVTVTDANNCQRDTCFEMPFLLHFITDIQTDTLNCYGDQDGMIRLTITYGEPPVSYNWKNSDNTLSGSGQILTDGETVLLIGLPAGVYSIQISDINFDSVFTAEIYQPEQIDIAISSVQDAACFSECNGSIDVNAEGGIAPYQYLWSNGNTNTLVNNLCAGNYRVTVTDANACQRDFNFTVGEPDEFIATAQQLRAVSCYQGSDGQATVTTNGMPASYLWSTGANSATIAGLSGGTYSVTVTNADGCTGTSTVEILTPPAPVAVSISQAKPITCNGGDDGILEASVSGPGDVITFDWSNGDKNDLAENLTAGIFTVTVTNEHGCSATASFTLGQPEEIAVQFSANQLGCKDPLDGGIVTVEAVTGGVAPYTFSADGFNFSAEPVIDGYTAGSQVFYVKDDGGCVRQFSAYIEGPKEIMIDAGQDETVQLGEEIELIAQANLPGLDYLWEPAEWLSCSDCPSPVAKPVNKQVFRVTVTDAFGCTKSDQVVIDVIKIRRVFLPNAFSPNADGINDEFVPFGGSDVARIKSFKIFDRQGNMVFTAFNFQQADMNSAWDGTFNGKRMQPGVFVWFAEIEFVDNEVEIFRGDVMLIK
jgi:gliding motility-associated-like protein